MAQKPFRRKWEPTQQLMPHPTATKPLTAPLIRRDNVSQTTFTWRGCHRRKILKAFQPCKSNAKPPSRGTLFNAKYPSQAAHQPVPAARGCTAHALLHVASFECGIDCCFGAYFARFWLFLSLKKNFPLHSGICYRSHIQVCVCHCHVAREGEIRC